MSKVPLGAPSATFDLHRVTQEWGEGTSDAAGSGANEGSGAPATANDATWLHTFFDAATWTLAGGDFDATASGSLIVGGVGTYTWASTSRMVADVQGWLDDPASNHGWLLKDAAETASKSAKRLDSRENATASNRPLLTIDYTADASPTVRNSWGAIKSLYR